MWYIVEKVSLMVSHSDQEINFQTKVSEPLPVRSSSSSTVGKLLTRQLYCQLLRCACSGLMSNIHTAASSCGDAGTLLMFSVTELIPVQRRSSAETLVSTHTHTHIRASPQQLSHISLHAHTHTHHRQACSRCKCHRRPAGLRRITHPQQHNYRLIWSLHLTANVSSL